MRRYKRTLGVPSDIRLYTWVDVEDLFLKIDGSGNWPDWLLSVRAYWDGVSLVIKRGKQASAKKMVIAEFRSEV